MKLTIEKLEKSELKISATVPASDFEKYHNNAFKKVQSLTNVDGFRKGNAPENVIVKAYGDMTILEEMANMCLHDVYLEAIKEHKISPISDPKVTITKLAKGNDFECNIVISILPEVTLPDYKKISENKVKDQTKDIVVDADIDSVLEELRKGRVQHNHHDHKEGEECKHEPVLPELNDEFAKSFGDNFTSLDNLKNKIRENLELEKDQKYKEKTRGAIVEALIEETKTDIPVVLIDQELERMLGQFKHDITRFGGTWQDYLKSTNKKEEDIKSDWRNDAVKRVMSQLILAEISLLEKIKPEDQEIETELTRLIAQVQDADENHARSYVIQALTNEKVLSFLEGSDK